MVAFRIRGNTPPSAAGSLTSASGGVPVFTPTASQAKNISSLGETTEGQSATADFGEKVLKQTENQLVGMAVGSIARATLGRVPIAGPVLASAVGGAIMQEVSNQNVIDKVNDKGREVLNKSSDARDDIIKDSNNDEKMEDGEEFKLCKSDPEDASAPTLDVDESIYCSTLDSLDNENVPLSPTGRLVFDYEDVYDWTQDKESEPVWVWLSLGSFHLDSIPAQWLSDGTKSCG